MYMISGEITGCSGCSWVHSNVEKKITSDIFKRPSKNVVFIIQKSIDVYK